MDSMARLHCIFYDSALCDLSNFLKTGVMQIILSMLEAGFINNELALDDTVRALSEWSQDPTFSKTARTLNGKQYTAVEHQLAIFEAASRFVDSGIVDDRVIPGLGEIMNTWEETLLLLKSKSFEKLSSKLDWVLKKKLLERARDEHSLDWDSPQMKHLDLLYSSLDREEGLYWLCERSGAVERIVSDEEIVKCIERSPDNTRAWFRSYLLNNAVNEDIEIEKINWDVIEFKLKEGDGNSSFSSQRVRINMDDPLGFTKGKCSSLINSTESLSELILTLGEKFNTFSNTINSFPYWKN
jgi:proteasome accessory factor A